MGNFHFRCWWNRLYILWRSWIFVLKSVCHGSTLLWVRWLSLFQPLIWFPFTRWTKGMKRKDGFMANVVECCFASCLCLCIRHSLAFCKCYFKGPPWNLVDLSAGLTLVDQVCFAGATEAGLPQTPWVLSATCGNGVESCLVADVGKKPWLGLVRDHTVPVLPWFPLHLPVPTSALAASLCVTPMQQKPQAHKKQELLHSVLHLSLSWAQECQGGEAKKRTRALRNFPSPCMGGGKPAPEFTFCREILTVFQWPVFISAC